MSPVRDITCPSCGSTTQLGKLAVGQYHCEACGREFTPEDVLPG